jgi:acetyl esterase/lipase
LSAITSAIDKLYLKPMRKLFIVILVLIPISTFSQKKYVMYLWPGNVPGEQKEKQLPVIDTTRKDNVLRFSEVTNPSIEIFLPDESVRNGASVVVCPGGGYNILAYDKEGTEIAEWLNKNGITAFVLQYRVPNKKEGALQDIQRAIRIVKANAQKWKLETDKIGVMGFSAGGSLSARASTLFNKKTYSPVDRSDSLSCRPSFALLIYPAYLDQGPDHTITPELQISKEVPQMFIFQTADDQYGNSALVMAGVLRNAKIPVELHLLPKGGHGYGLRQGNIAASTWPVLAERWLERILKEKTNPND